MSNEEAIDTLKDILAEATSSDSAVCYVTDCDAEPLRMAIEALEKRTPKKSYLITYDVDNGCKVAYWVCPECGSVLNACSRDYCQVCSQKIDWSKEK